MNTATVHASKSTGRYVLLDGMRGVAAISVALFHLAWQVDLQKVLFAHAYLAVDFFFMLSGFVIAASYEGKLASGRLSFANFILMRIARLFPMILVGTLIALGVHLFILSEGFSRLSLSQILQAAIHNLVLFPLSLDPDAESTFGFPLNKPMWSLFWEFVVNILFALLLIRARVSAKFWIGLTLVAAVVLLGFALTHNGLGRGDREWLGGAVRVAFSFFAGVVIWHLHGRLTWLRLPVWLQLAVLLLIMACPMIPHVNSLFDAGVVLFVFPVIIVAACNSMLDPRAEKAATWLGDISYPLYAMHYPFMPLLELSYREQGWSKPVSFLIVVGICIAMVIASKVILVAVDEPLRKRLRTLLSRSANRAPAGGGSSLRETLSNALAAGAVQERGRRYEVLDGLRGVAAIAVLLFHLGWQLEFENVLFPHGYLAVDFFFMLSGFVISEAYLSKLGSGRVSFGEFLLNRVIRLYPMIVVGTLIGIGVRLWMVSIGLIDDGMLDLLGQAVAGLLISPITIDPSLGSMSYGFPLNQPIWSIFWELVVNIAFALLIIGFRRHLTLFILIGCAAAIALSGYSLGHNGVDRAHVWESAFIRVSFSFFFGALLWQFRHLKLPVAPGLGLVLLVFVALMAAPLLPRVNALYDVGAILIAFPVILLVASQFQVQGTVARTFAFLGALSFPLYAIHGPLLWVIEYGNTVSSWSAPVRVVVLLVSTVAIMAVSYAVLVKIDEPARALLRARLLNRPSAKATTTS